MTRSESQFRVWWQKENPGGFIQKIPDFKATGSIAGAGLPDYITISLGNTAWYEVKTSSNKYLTPAQKRVFPKMVEAGAVIYIWTKLKRRNTCILYTK